MAAIKKKTLLLDQDLIRRVRGIYKAKTETEAITRALEDAAFRDELTRVFRRMAGKIPHIEKVF